MSDAGTGSPYRSGRGSAPPAQPHDNGIVDELIQQFADPLAFYRELVQNSIDAGSSGIAVTVGWDPDHEDEGDASMGVTRISVRDDGCGMSRDVLENQLTVLFRSGKEGQTDKIGKFGVGFVSVLALRPERVVVRTSEGTGELWTLELKSDQTYELFQAQGGGSAGTSVTLEVSMPRAEVEGLIEGSERALVTWCRHAEIPIRFVAALEDAPLREVRIDRPLGLDGLLAVRVSDGPTTVVAGLTEAGGSYLGFFNRGLLLHETRQPIFGDVHVKILDANLEHTLSRDNVRRDAHHDRAIRVARDAVERRLTDAVRQRLDAVARGAEESPRLDALLLATLRAGLGIDYGRVTLPLTDPVGGAQRLPIEELERHAYATSGSSALTAALAERRVPVIELGAAGDAATYQAVLERLLGRAPANPYRELTLAIPVETTASDELLLAETLEILDGCARRPSAIRLAILEGRRSGEVSIAADLGRRALALTEEEASSDPFRLLMRPPLVLNAQHTMIERARELATERPRLAAAMAARAVLLTRGRLDADADDAWLEHALRRLAR